MAEEKKDVSEFEVDGVKFLVRDPNDDDIREADKVYNRTMKDCLETGVMLRIKMEEHLKKQNIWNMEKEAEAKRLQKEIIDREVLITVKQKEAIKLSQGKNIALEIKTLRNELTSLLAERNYLMKMTAESQADDARFSCLVSRCTVYYDGRKAYFKDYADYVVKQSTAVALKASEAFLLKVYSLGDYDESLPENKFLKKFKFVDSQYRLINKEGHLVDKEGRLIDEDGRYVAYKDGNKVFVDKFGNEKTEEGEYAGEPASFVDDDGNPVIE